MQTTLPPISELVFASGNMGKAQEVSRVFAPYGIKVWSARDIGEKRQLGAPPRVDEVGGTYLENASLKARAYLAWSGVPSLGDDSGLEVDILDGAPGLYSARYAGAGASDDDNNRKLVAALSCSATTGNSRDAQARYVSYVVLLMPDGRHWESHGVLEGGVTTEGRGHGGFGYDPHFVVQEYDRSLAQLKEEGVVVKTHRILALEGLLGRMGIVPIV